MTKLINKPNDPYSPLWAAYWAQNPFLNRGVGADGVNDDDDDDAGKGNGDDDDTGKKDDDADTGKKDDDANKGDGDNKPSDAEAKLLKEVMKKKDTINAQKDELDKVSRQLAKFDGIDLDKVKDLLKAQKDAETQALEDKGQWDSLKSQMVDQHNADMKELKEAAAELNKQLTGKDSVIKKLTVGHAFDSSTFISEKLTLTPSKARIIFGSHFDNEGDKVIAYDKPSGDASRVQLVDGKGDPLAFDAAIQKIVDADSDRDTIVKSGKKPGSGSSTDNGKPNKSKPTLHGSDKIAAALNATK